MSSTSKWVRGGLVGLLGLFGLFIASRAQDDTFYAGGLLLAAVCLIYIFWLIKHTYDDMERAEAERRLLEHERIESVVASGNQSHSGP